MNWRKSAPTLATIALYVLAVFSEQLNGSELGSIASVRHAIINAAVMSFSIAILWYLAKFTVIVNMVGFFVALNALIWIEQWTQWQISQAAPYAIQLLMLTVPVGIFIGATIAMLAVMLFDFRRWGVLQPTTPPAELKRRYQVRDRLQRLRPRWPRRKSKRRNAYDTEIERLNEALKNG